MALSHTLRRLAALAILVAGAVWVGTAVARFTSSACSSLVNAIGAALIAAVLLAWGGQLAALAGIAYAVGTLAAFLPACTPDCSGSSRGLPARPR